MRFEKIRINLTKVCNSVSFSESQAIGSLSQVDRGVPVSVIQGQSLVISWYAIQSWALWSNLQLTRSEGNAVLGS